MKIASFLKHGPQPTQKLDKAEAAAPQSRAEAQPTDKVQIEAKTPKEPGLLTKAARAVTDPIVNFAKRTVGDTLLMTAAASAVSAATLGAVAVAGPVGLLVPVGVGVVGGIAGGKAAAKMFKRRKDARFQGVSTGAALASYGVAGALGASAAAGLPLAAAACTAAGVAGGIGMSAAGGAIYGFGNTLMTQGLEAMAVLNKREA